MVVHGQTVTCGKYVEQSFVGQFFVHNKAKICYFRLILHHGYIY